MAKNDGVNTKESFEKYMARITKYKIKTFEDARNLVNKIDFQKLNFYNFFYELYLNYDFPNTKLNKNQKQRIIAKAKSSAKKKAQHILELPARDRKLKVILSIYELILSKSTTLDEAIRIKKKMQSEGMKLTPHMYKSLIEKCTKYSEAKEIENEMASLGIRISNKIRVHTLILDKYDKEKKIIECNENSNEIPNDIPNDIIVTLSQKKEGLNKIKKPKLCGKINPLRKTIILKRVERKNSVVSYLKKLYNDTCQICGQRLKIGENRFYSEVHHIQPLGYHHGPDVIENAIVLCPNHHALFDKGAITIDTEQKVVIHFEQNNTINGKKIELKHNIYKKYINYHNENIFVKPNSQNSLKNVHMEFYPQRCKDEIFYGDKVKIQDIETYDEIEIILESYYNRMFMNEIQKKLLGRKNGEVFRFNKYYYKIIKFQRYK